VHDRWNAFVDLDPALRGGEGPLAGVTVGVKANIAVKGLPWTAGMALYRDRIADRDSKVVARLRGQGAAILGTLNMEEAALGAKTDNPWFGATQNPHRAGFTPGGSSGGSGAAVAAGLCDVALGTDTMGSVRIPASYCGVYGFKPAQASISQDGMELAEPDFDTIGVLARDMDVLERVVRTISEFGEGANEGPGIQANGATLSDLGSVECHADVLAMFARAQGAMGRLQNARLTIPLSRVRFAGFIKTSKYMANAFATADQALLSPRLRKLLSYGPARNAEDWDEDQHVLETAAQEVRGIIAKNGYFILPTAPQPAFSHHEAAPANQADFTCIANVAGLPAVSIPAGWSEDNLPIGIQLIGQTGHEAGLFDLAKSLDRALAAYRPPANS
jgi:aspartyl-tRNA(Asn)/glutamyl-tRNA(Gln) amidotransferase subunit A